jgi:hypothetical protein
VNPIDPDTLLGKLVMGLIRHGLTTAAGGLVAHGWLTGSQAQEGVGAVVVLIGLGLSVYDKVSAHAKLTAAQTTTDGH